MWPNMCPMERFEWSGPCGGCNARPTYIGSVNNILQCERETKPQASLIYVCIILCYIILYNIIQIKKLRYSIHIRTFILITFISLL